KFSAKKKGLNMDIGQTLQNIIPFDHLFNHTNNEILRSLEVDDFKINVAPTSGKVSSAPTMVRLSPPPVKPLHLHANLPLRFGRDSQPDDTHSPKSTLNLPQRFGRAQGSVATFMTSCIECPRIGTVPSATLPPRFSRNEFYHNNNTLEFITYCEEVEVGFTLLNFK
uniref:Uncharacterized protein n=1 Tax=Oncorhynchus mykiss TaxID=8022 RepID=A0A8K9X8L3_ONCMY